MASKVWRRYSVKLGTVPATIFLHVPADTFVPRPGDILRWKPARANGKVERYAEPKRCRVTDDGWPFLERW